VSVQTDIIARVNSALAGKTSADMPIYSTIDHATPAYVRSRTAWAYPFELTAIAVRYSAHTFGCVAVTALHGMTASHPWTLGDPTGAVARFVTQGGVLVERTITDYRQIGATDMLVVQFDSPLPSSIRPARSIPAAFGPGLGVPVIWQDQEAKASLLKLVALQGGTDDLYAVAVDPMTGDPEFPEYGETIPAWDGFQETPVAGDSGHGSFIPFKHHLGLLVGHATPITGQSATSYLTEINAAIDDMDPGYAIESIDLSAEERMSYLDLPGTSGAHATTPDAAALTPGAAGVDIRAKLAMNDWTPAATSYVVAKLTGVTAGTMEYALRITTTGFIQLVFSNGGAVSSLTSFAAPTVANGATTWVRAVFDPSAAGENPTGSAGDGTVKFYQSADGVSWSSLDDPTAENNFGLGGGGYTIRNGTSVLCVGARPDTGAAIAGKCYYAEVRTAAGTVLAVADFESQANATTSFSDGTNTWTVNGTASIVGEVAASGPSGFRPTQAVTPAIALGFDH
jgi:hypothetical protein